VNEIVPSMITTTAAITAPGFDGPLSVRPLALSPTPAHTAVSHADPRCADGETAGASHVAHVVHCGALFSSAPRARRAWIRAARIEMTQCSPVGWDLEVARSAGVCVGCATFCR
jgi:hypothetical protein